MAQLLGRPHLAIESFYFREYGAAITVDFKKQNYGQRKYGKKPLGS